MLPKLLPEDLNAEELLTYYSAERFRLKHNGNHNRNAYKDVFGLEQLHDGKMLLYLGRNSIYDSLPEYLFHPIDRFNNNAVKQDKEEFDRQYGLLQQEKEAAYGFFAPIDVMLMLLRLHVRKNTSQYVSQNKVLIDILSDNISEEQKENVFIRQLLPFLPYCKLIRGNRTLISLMLRKIFMNEKIALDIHKTDKLFKDNEPRYCDCIFDGRELDDYKLNDYFAGNEFEENVTVYNVHYWDEEQCNVNFLDFVKSIEQLQQFIQDWFFGIEDIFCFNIYNESSGFVLKSEEFHDYLGYNTNI